MGGLPTDLLSSAQAAIEAERQRRLKDRMLDDPPTPQNADVAPQPRHLGGGPMRDYSAYGASPEEVQRVSRPAYQVQPTASGPYEIERMRMQQQDKAAQPSLKQRMLRGLLAGGTTMLAGAGGYEPGEQQVAQEWQHQADQARAERLSHRMAEQRLREEGIKAGSAQQLAGMRWTEQADIAERREQDLLTKLGQQRGEFEQSLAERSREADQRRVVAEEGQSLAVARANQADATRRYIADANMAMRRDLAAQTAAIQRERIAASADPNKPTTMTRNQAQLAQSILPHIGKLRQDIDNAAAVAGPVAGRWNTLYEGQGGFNDDPSGAFMRLRGDVGMFQSAVMLAHARGRMSNVLFEHFTKLFNLVQQDPQNAKILLDVGEEWLQGYANMVGQGGGGGATPSNETVIDLTKPR